MYVAWLVSKSFCGFVVMLGGVYSGVPLQANMYPQHFHPGSPAQRMMGPPYQQYPPPQGQTSPLPPGMHPYPNPAPMSPPAGSPGAPPMFPAGPQGSGAVTGRAADRALNPRPLSLAPSPPPHPPANTPPRSFSHTVLTVTPDCQPCRLSLPVTAVWLSLPSSFYHESSGPAAFF